MAIEHEDEAGGVEAADIAVAQAAAPLRDNPLVRVAGTLSEIGDQPQLVALSVATIGAGLWRVDARLVEAGARMLASHLLATGIKAAIKHAVDRTRPHVMNEEGRYRRGPGEHDEGSYNSFPSGHTAGAVAVARAAARMYPEQAGPAYAAAAAIALVQVPRGAHYLSDIAAGAAIGWAAETTVNAVWPA